MSPVRYTEEGPLAVAHRGGAALHPENTLTAFAHAYGLGVRWLETDVRVSADGVAVLHHDRTLRRLFGLDAAVADLTWDRLRSLRTPAGDRLVRPVDVLDAFPDARFAVDLKDPAVVPGLLADVRRTRSAGRVCLAGAPDALLERAAAAGPGLTTALGWRSLVSLIAAARLGTPARGVGRRPPHARWAHVPDRLLGAGVLTAGVVARAEDLGLHVMAWTVDDPARMHELLDIGVRGVITDRPDLLREVLVARGQWRRPEQATAPRTGASGIGADT
ncbi:glycerophosphodiester phosphodiesterase family protein [Jannaschia sp. R86511]|uniref:glycerophosphodiester phosphodiesterase family protein n=1 Tax=Jannaschia sp. R86511 TaxID=3093853 RepID=UPI0036D2133F